MWKAGRPTNSGTIQAQIQLVHPNIYLNFELLEYMKGLVLVDSKL